MIPITQDRVGRDGNCLSACLASILEVPLQTVPDFAAETRTDEELLRAVDAWLAKKGLRYRQVALGDAAPVGYHTVEGLSPRGGQHACVAKDGALVWDPHPRDGTGRGLVRAERWGVLEPRSAARSGDATKSLGLWKYNRITGYWVLQRTVEEQDAQRWLSIFQRDEPLEKFKLSHSKPSGRPAQDQKPGDPISLPNGRRAEDVHPDVEEILRAYQSGGKSAASAKFDEIARKKKLKDYEALMLAEAFKRELKMRTSDQKPGDPIRLPNGRRTTVEKVTPARNLFGEEELHVKTTTGEVLPVPVRKERA